MAKQQASEPIDPQTRLAAAWPDGLPPKLMRRIDLVRSEAEFDALMTEIVDKGHRLQARRAAQPPPPGDEG